tara:strand:+ start:327 stop:1862 length:1536 start_codon:yes stop_codon:yes gene_type:complete
MRYALTFLLMATIALGQGVWPKTATVVDGGHRYDFDTLGKRSVTPSADYGNIVLWQAFSYSDNSDADFYDLSVEANDGSQTTAASQPTWSSADGGVYDFDGVDDAIEVADSSVFDFGSGNFALQAWINKASTNTVQIVAGKWLDANRQFTLTATSLGRIQVGYTTAGSGASQVYLFSSNGSYSDNTWTHVVGQRNGNSFDVYANGSLVSSGTTAGSHGSMYAGTAEVQIGAQEFVGARAFFDGNIGDVRIYDSALTAAEILAVADNTAATYYPYFSGFTESFDTYADLALWMPFTSDETPDYIDKGPIGNDGSQTTASSQPTWSSADGGVYDFDGVDDFIDIDTTIADLAATTVGSWTSWVNISDATPSDRQYPIAFGDANVNNVIGLNIEADGKLRALSAPNGWLLLTDSSVMSSNTWQFLSLTQNGTSPVLYVDGVAVAQTFAVSIDKTFWFSDNGGIDTARVGAIKNFSNPELKFVEGYIDDVRIYSTALTATEVLAIYNNTKGTYGL